MSPKKKVTFSKSDCAIQRTNFRLLGPLSKMFRCFLSTVRLDNTTSVLLLDTTRTV